MTTRVTIKLPTKKVIELLSAKLSEREQWKKDYKKILERETKARKAWESAVIAYAEKNGTKKAFQAVAEKSHHLDGNSVRVVFYFKTDLLPEKPQDEARYDSNPNNYHWQEETRELEEALRLLTLAEENGQDTISTGTYRNLSRWL